VVGIFRQFCPISKYRVEPVNLKNGEKRKGVEPVQLKIWEKICTVNFSSIETRFLCANSN